MTIIKRKVKPCTCWKYSNGRKCSVCELAAKKVEKKLSESEIKERDKQFFIHVWENSPHICQETGRKLPEYESSDPDYSYLIRWHIHHVLPKSKYPKFRWDERNVVIVSRDIHDILDHSTSDKVKELKIYPIVDKIKTILLAEL